jgi:hypothetical protein
MYKLILITFLTFAKLCLLAQCSENFPAWLEGKWSVQPPVTETIEEWRKDGEYILKAEIYRHFEGEKLVFDDMLIKCINDEIIMEVNAIMGKYKVKAGFKLTEYNDNKIVFENPVTDYPNKISYTRIANDTVYVNVYGKSPENSSMDAELVRIKTK